MLEFYFFRFYTANIYPSKAFRRCFCDIRNKNTLDLTVSVSVSSPVRSTATLASFLAVEGDVGVSAAIQRAPRRRLKE